MHSRLSMKEGETKTFEIVALRTLRPHPTALTDQDNTLIIVLIQALMMYAFDPIIILVTSGRPFVPLLHIRIFIYVYLCSLLSNLAS